MIPAAEPDADWWSWVPRGAEGGSLWLRAFVKGSEAAGGFGAGFFEAEDEGRLDEV